MTGKNCVAIASDRRFGVGAQTISTNFQVSYSIMFFLALVNPYCVECTFFSCLGLFIN